MDFSKVKASVVRETEKAYQLNISYWTKAEKPAKERKTWCPKSCCKTEDGKVVEVANFILERLAQEIIDYVKQYFRYPPTIRFDMEAKEVEAKRLKDKKEAERREWDEKLEKVADHVLPYAIDFIKEIGSLCAIFSAYLKERGCTERVDKLIDLAKRIEAKYGKWEKEKVDNLHKYIAEQPEQLKFYLKDCFDLWVLGDFRIYEDRWDAKKAGFSYYDFQDVKTTIIGTWGKPYKKMKDVIGFKKEYNDILNDGVMLNLIP